MTAFEVELLQLALAANDRNPPIAPYLSQSIPLIGANFIKERSESRTLFDALPQRSRPRPGAAGKAQHIRWHQS